MRINGRQVKAFLKESGFETKAIKVRVNHWGYGDTYIDVDLFDLNLRLKKSKQSWGKNTAT